MTTRRLTILIALALPLPVFAQQLPRHDTATGTLPAAAPPARHGGSWWESC